MAPGLTRLERSRPAWRVLRALDELAGADWKWRGQPEELAQRAAVERAQVYGLLRGLEQENLIDLLASWHTSHISITWRSTPRSELRELLALVRPGLAPLLTFTPCAAAGPGRARCGLFTGHSGHHVDGAHPVLRSGEMLVWPGAGP